MYVLANWITKRPLEALIVFHGILVLTYTQMQSVTVSMWHVAIQLAVLVVLGVLARQLRKRERVVSKELERFKTRNLQTIAAASTYARALPRGTVEEQNLEYKNLLLSFLANHFPSGLRMEPLDMQPMERACHLYVDLPKHLPLPGHQLRFALNEHEAMMLRKLRAYEKPRVAGMAGENHQLLTLFVQTSDPSALTLQ